MIRASMRCARKWSSTRIRASRKTTSIRTSATSATRSKCSSRTERTERVAIDYPIGHRTRRAEGIPLLVRKFETSVKGRLTERQFTALKSLCTDQQKLETTPVDDFMALLVSG
jgi:2-methylcitrate dehydratase PrpD